MSTLTRWGSATFLVWGGGSAKELLVAAGLRGAVAASSFAAPGRAACTGFCPLPNFLPFPMSRIKIFFQNLGRVKAGALLVKRGDLRSPHNLLFGLPAYCSAA